MENRIGGNVKEVTVTKSEFEESFIQIFHTLKNYGELIDESTTDGVINVKKAATLLPGKVNSLDFGSVNIQAMELIGAYLISTLKMLKTDSVKFLVPEEPEDDFFKINSGLEDLSRNIQESESELREIEEKVYYLTRFLNLAHKGKIRRILRSVSVLFKSIVRQDSMDIQNSILSIHHLTASKDSHFLFNDIGKMAREVYNNLQDFSSGLPLEDLDANMVDEMPDAVTKLTTVIQRMEESANSTLDEVENLLDKNAEEQEKVSGIVEKISLVEDQLKQLHDSHPEIAQEVNTLLAEVKDDIHAQVSKSVETLQANGAIYLKIMENQSFQDLSGQTLKKIIAFIEQLEFNLLNLLSKYSGKEDGVNEPASEKTRPGIVGAKIDGETVLEGPQDHSSEQSSSQNDVDSLLSQFGF